MAEGTVFVDIVGNAAGFNKTLKEVGDNATNVSQSIMSSFKQVAAYMGVALSVGALISYGKECVLTASRVETLGVVLKLTGEHAGFSSGETKAYVEQVKAMGITTQAAQNSITKMAQAQMDLSKSSQLARIAQDAAVIANTNSSDAFERMIYGIKSGQTEVLKTMGINVNFAASYAKLGAELNKSAMALTEQEKVMARTNALLEYGPRIMGVYEASMGTAGKAMLSLARWTEELQLKLGVVAQPALKVFVDALTVAFKEAGKGVGEFIDSGDMSKMATSIANGAVTVVKSLTAIVKSVQHVIGFLREWGTTTTIIAESAAAMAILNSETVAWAVKTGLATAAVVANTVAQIALTVSTFGLTIALQMLRHQTELFLLTLSTKNIVLLALTAVMLIAITVYNLWNKTQKDAKKATEESTAALEGFKAAMSTKSISYMSDSLIEMETNYNNMVETLKDKPLSLIDIRKIEKEKAIMDSMTVDLLEFEKAQREKMKGMTDPGLIEAETAAYNNQHAVMKNILDLKQREINMMEAGAGKEQTKEQKEYLELLAKEIVFLRQAANLDLASGQRAQDAAIQTKKDAAALEIEMNQKAKDAQLATNKIATSKAIMDATVDNSKRASDKEINDQKNKHQIILANMKNSREAEVAIIEKTRELSIAEGEKEKDAAIAQANLVFENAKQVIDLEIKEKLRAQTAAKFDPEQQKSERDAKTTTARLANLKTVADAEEKFRQGSVSADTKAYMDRQVLATKELEVMAGHYKTIDQYSEDSTRTQIELINRKYESEMKAAIATSATLSRAQAGLNTADDEESYKKYKLLVDVAKTAGEKIIVLEKAIGEETKKVVNDTLQAKAQAQFTYYQSIDKYGMDAYSAQLVLWDIEASAQEKILKDKFNREKFIDDKIAEYELNKDKEIASAKLSAMGATGKGPDNAAYIAQQNAVFAAEVALEAKRMEQLKVDYSAKEALAQKEMARDLQLLESKKTFYESIIGYEEEALKAAIDAANKKAALEKREGKDPAAVEAKRIQTIGKLEADATNKKIESIRVVMGANATAFESLSQLYAEDSNERKKLHEVAMAFAAIEKIAISGMAVLNAANAIAASSAAPPPAGFIAMAAMAAAMVGLLASVGIAFGGGSVSAPSAPSAPSAAYGQNTTVLGGANNEGSQSIQKSWELLQDTYDMEYHELRNIYNEMKQLNTNVTGIVRGIVTGNIGSMAMGGLGASKSSGISSGLSSGLGSLAMGAGIMALIASGPGGWFGLGAMVLDKVLGTGIGEKIGGWLFGSGSSTTSQTASGIMVGGGAVKPYATSTTHSEWEGAFGGLFGGGGSSTTYNRMEGAVNETLTNLFYGERGVYTTLKRSVSAMATMLGGDAAKAQNKVFAAFELNLMGMDSDAIEKAVSRQISTIGDAFVKEVLGSIVSIYQQVGEGIYETATRLVVDKAVVMENLRLTNQAFEGTIPELIKFSEALITVAGGLDKLIESMQTYYDKFFSDAEKQADLQMQMTKTLAYYGFDLPGSRTGYRSLVESLNLTSEAGQTAYVALMQMSEGADRYYKYLEDVKGKISPESYSTNLEYQRALAGMPKYADGGSFTGGYRIVGESGPEIEYTGPSRIYSNKDSKSLLNNDALLLEIRELRAELGAGNFQIAVNTQKSAKFLQYLEQWDDDGMPPVRS